MNNLLRYLIQLTGPTFKNYLVKNPHFKKFVNVSIDKTYHVVKKASKINKNDINKLKNFLMESIKEEIKETKNLFKKKK
jgi:hypothetical protein